MDSFHKHILERLDNIEAGLNELREVTWPVCQGILDKSGPFENKQEKRKFFSFMHIEDIMNLLRRKARFTGTSPSSAVSELQWILVEVPSEVAESM
jgi:hypothetical protein